MTNWKPTESLKRADELASTIHCDIVAAGGNVTTLARHRMVQLLEEAIETTLAEGREAAGVSLYPTLEDAPVGNGHGTATADPVGFDPIISDEDYENAVAPLHQQDEFDRTMAIDPLVKDESRNTKKRGRPKGKKTKAAKKAKKSKEVLHTGDTGEVTEDMGREIPEQVETPQDPQIGEAPAS